MKRRSLQMTYKTIAVYVDDSKHCKGRISVAADLAMRFDAHLVGIYATEPIPASHALQDPWLAERLATRSAAASERTALAATLFQSVAGQIDVARREFREVDSDAIEAIKAQQADLIVVGQTDPDERVTTTPANFPELVTLSVGRPVLFVPYFANAYPALGSKILVAWNGSREATRAVTDSLPLLTKAERVTAMVVNAKRDRKQREDIPAADISLFLARHGVKVEATQSYPDELSVGDELLVRVADGEFDLLVMGAYGHSRFREIILGGVTQTLLQHMTVPVLMSH
jgi:nucleotide-binding universal stress UspA family protein